MKILHVVSSMELGGIESLVFSMMQKDVQNVYILAIEGTREEAYLKWPALSLFGNNLFFVNKKEGFSYKTVTQLIKKTCQQYSISVLHSHHIGPLIYGSLVCYFLKFLKHVHTQHDIWHLHDRKQWLIEYFILTLRKKIHLVAISRSIFNEMTRLFPRNKISLVHNGIDTDRFKPGNKQEARALLQLPLDAKIIACAGRLETVKGQKYLIQAMAYLPSDYFLAIAGKGTLFDALQEEAKKLGGALRICFLGQIDQIELLYQASNLFCLPSLDEGLPLSILEAQACNLPVVCTDVGSCAEGIDPEVGCLVAPKDPKAIAQACMELMDSTKHPREYILSQFSLTVLIEKYQQIYAMP